MYQVAVNVGDERTYRREVRALWEALDENSQTEAVLIVGNGPESVLERDGKRIVQVPAWKWFLSSSRNLS